MKTTTFPSAGAFPANNTETTDEGLTKREYFAAMALQGLLAHGWNVHEYKDAAIHATKASDALINALNKTK